MEMQSTWLVQRLKKPFPQRGDGPSLANVFSFGGGLRNGGLSEEAMGTLNSIWRFDYMGSAEFEFGAVPEALQRIAREKNLDGWWFTIPLKQVAPDWRPENTPLDDPSAEATIYVLAPSRWAPLVEERIKALAAERYNRRLKEATYLAGALRPYREWDTETCGWLELDNGFLFFTDEEMWAKTLELFGVAERDRV